MPLHVTPEILESVYELLRLTPPFRGWRLPDGDDVVFSVLRTVEFQGDYVFERGRHQIRISGPRHKTITTLAMSMAHEMCHMRDAIKGGRVNHGKEFQRMADAVCRVHGWDRGQF